MVQHQKSFEQNKKKCNNCKKRKRAAHQAYPQAEKIMCPLWFEEVYNRVLLSGVKTRAPSLTHYALACQKKKKKSQISRRSAHNTAAHPYRSCNTKSVLQTPGEKKKKKKETCKHHAHSPQKKKDKGTVPTGHISFASCMLSQP